MRKEWISKNLADVSTVFTDGDWIESKDQSPSGVRLIQTGNVGEGFFKNRIEKARYISEATFKRLNCTEIFEGDCLVSRLPEPVGRSCILPKLDERTITAVDCSILRFSPEILPEFFVFFSQSYQYLTEVDRNCTGATRKRISRKNLMKIKIPVPSITEQKKIIKILSDKFRSILELESLTKKQISEGENLFDSQLNDVFKNLINDTNFMKFGDVADFVRGPFGGSLKKAFFKPQGYAVYEQQHAIYDQFTDIRYFVDEKKFTEMKRFEVFPGDLIMSCSGTIGKTAIVPEGVKQGIINQALLKLTPQKDLLDVRYMQWWMKSSLFDEEIKANSGGAAISNVASVKVLKEIMVPVPSLSKQKSIVKELDNYLQKKNDLIEIFKKKQAGLIELKKSYLQEAFAGKL